MLSCDRSRWLLALLVALAAAALHIALYQYVNPTAALRMKVFRGQATEIAEQFLSRERISTPAGYRRSTLFYTSDHAKAYLEQTLGLEKANQLMQSDGMVYHWSVRWFKPGEQKQLAVQVDPDGRVVSYAQMLPGDAPAPKSHRPREVAEQFVAQVANIDVRAYALRDSFETPRANRRDYGYTWERKGFRLGQATQRVSAVVTGDKVISYRRFLWVPESFDHQFETQQEKGNSLAGVADALSVVFVLVGIIAIIRGLRRRTLYWRGALPVAAVVAAIGLLNDLNTLPLTYARFDVSQSEMSFWLDHAVQVGLAAVGRFVMVIGALAAAEWIFRGSFPAWTTIPRWFTRAGLASLPGRRRLSAGYLLALGHLGYVTVFYYLGTRYAHAWAPAQVPYDDLFGTAVPWAYALLIGVEASVSEEFLFRVLAVSWLRRVTKRDWLAILIPALIWGFAHCSYPNKPFYIRGIELSIWGVVLGWAFIRFGVLPGLVAHATFNAIVVGEAFLSSVVWLPRLNFAVIVVAILVPLAASLWWSRRRAQEAGVESNEEFDRRLREEAARQPEVVPLDTVEPAWQPLPRRSWIVGVAGLAVGLAVFALLEMTGPGASKYKWKTVEAHPWREKCIGRSQAGRIAAKAIAAEGARVNGWPMSAIVDEAGIDDDARTYLEQFVKPDDVDALSERVSTPGFLWVVRWQKPLQREEWSVRIRPDGRIWDTGHSLPEETPGAHLLEKQARNIAERALRDQGFDLNRFRLTGSRQHEYPRRTAHTFTWEPKGLKVGKAQFLTEVSVDGDRVSWLDRWVDPPGSYVFERGRETARKSVGMTLSTVLGLGLFFWALGSCFGAIKSYHVDWRWAFRVAAAFGAGILVIAALQSPMVWAGLPETVAPATYVAEAAIGGILGFSLLLAGFAALLAVARSVWRTGFPDAPGPGFWGSAICRPWHHRAVWREAVLAQLVLFGVVMPLIGIGEMVAAWLAATRAAGPSGGGDVTIPTWLVSSIPLLRPDGSDGLGDALAGLWPCMYIFVLVLLVAALLPISWLIAAGLAKRMFRAKRTALAILLAALALPVLSETSDWQGAVSYLVSAGLVVLGIWVAFALILRFNALALSAAMVVAGLAGAAWDLAWFPAHRAGALVLLTLAAALPLWALVSAVVAWRTPTRKIVPTEPAPASDDGPVPSAGDSREAGNDDIAA